MRIFIACIGVFLCVMLLRNAIKKVPWAWYGVALCAVAAYFLLPVSLAMHGDSASSMFAKAMQRGTFGFALLVVVMFIGTLDQASSLRRWLGPIRRQLSIAGCVLMVPHVAFYASTYFRSGALFQGGNVAFALTVAVVILALGILLFVTSFLVVKRRMRSATWKRIQACSYAFFGLAFVHVMLFLVPSALAGRVESQVNVAVYALIAGVYIVMRLHRCCAENRGNARKSDELET